MVRKGREEKHGNRNGDERGQTFHLPEVNKNIFCYYIIMSLFCYSAHF